MDRQLWQKAEEIFLECADLSKGELELLLDRRCEEDSELRELVLSLLDGDAKEDTLHDVVSDVATDLSATNADRWIGAELGAFTVDDRLAEGGMGIVYLAHRSDQQFDQRVAIKLLPTGLATDDLRQRFRSERQILANLKHPNIAMLLDGGETDEGVPYLVMEYVEGTFAAEYCQDRHSSLTERINLFLDVCSAVQYAHSNLVVHRDIKPSNILVTESGVPKLLDFGIAKLVDPASSADVGLTMVGTRMYTPRHASPEQVRGDTITTATDVYALGLLLYELLTYSFPYEITSTTSAADIENTITMHTPPPPSTLANPEIAKKIRGDLDTIVLKCLRKQPDSRYESVAELAGDLRRFLENRPIQARPPTLGYLVARYWRRHRVAATGVVATIVAVIVGAAATTIGFIQAREAEQLALAEAHNAETISSFLTSLFEESDPNTSAGQERSVREVLEAGRDRVDAELGSSPLTRARVLATLSSVYNGLGDKPQAEELQEQAVALAEQHHADELLVAKLRNDLGDLYRNSFRLQEAKAMIASAIDLFERSGVDASDEWADALNNLGLVHDELDERELGLARLKESLRMRERLFTAPHPKIAHSLHNLAWHYSHSDDFALAEQYAVAAVDMRVAVFGEQHPRVAATTSLLSRIYLWQEKYEDAEREARRSLAIAEQVYDAGSPGVTYAMYDLASVLRDKGELEQARDLFAQIVELERVSFGEDSYDFGMSVKAHAGVLISLSEHDEAERLLRQALAIFEALPDKPRRALEATQALLAKILEH